MDAGERWFLVSVNIFAGVLVAFILVIFGVLGCSLCGGIDKTYSDGCRIGTITKFGNRGFVCRTWEGEMNLGGTHKSGNDTIPTTWQFSDPSGAFAERINELANSGKRVSIRYRQVWVRSVWASDSDYYVVGIEVVE